LIGTQNIDTIFNYHYFLTDLFKQLTTLYQDQFGKKTGKLTVYCGQQINAQELEKLKINQGRLTSINTFFSISTSCSVAVDFSDNGEHQSMGIGSVVFEIDIDLNPSILDLGVLLSKIGDFERAKRFYQRLLVELPLDYIDLGVLYNNLGEIYRQQGYLNETMKYYKKAINELIEPVGFHDEWFAIVHSNIGMVFDARSELFSTIYNGMATIFQRQVLPTSHPSIATTYMNMGLLYYAMQNISLTLGHIHKALEIFLGVLPKNHPQLAVTYISIGVLYDYQDRDFEAIDYYLKAEQIIDQSVLAPDHKLREDIY
ncbi:unnamed protein product, partial [Rotaria sp. Silwood1]